MIPENKSGNIKNTGWIEVITGPMFSGKTEELIRRVNRTMIANQNVKIFKSSIDKRYSENEIVSHDQSSIVSTSVEFATDIINLSSGFEVIAIDEAQFFDKSLVDVCKTIADKGCRVIVAGLDMDFKGNPFDPMPQLMATADIVTKLQAVCMRCGNPALYSHRKSDEEKQVMLGENKIYEPLCRSCYNKIMKK
jgi:thymidine kinase